MYYFRYEKGSQIFIALTKEPQKPSKALQLTRDEWRGCVPVSKTIKQGLEGLGFEADSSDFVHKYVADGVTVYHISKTRSPVQQTKLIKPVSDTGRNITTTSISKIESRSFSKEKPVEEEEKPKRGKRSNVAQILRILASILPSE
jgi:hypothetical protein